MTEDQQNPKEKLDTGAASGQGDAQATPERSLAEELEAARAQAKEYLALAQRAQADFVNYRRRMETEKGEALLAGRADLAKQILPALDDFELALKSKPDDLSQSDWVQGIELVLRKFRTALENAGIARFEPLGETFDPREQEAVAHLPSDDESRDKVTGVHRAGYKLGNRVIRPAQVIVGRGQD